MRTGLIPENPQSHEAGWESLTWSERRIVDLVCEGLTNPQIGERLHVSRRTVSTHLYRIFKKLGVKSRAELVAKTVRHQFDRNVTDDDPAR